MIRIAAAAYAFDPLSDWADFEAKMTDWVSSAAHHGADLLVFPEYGSLELAHIRGVADDLEAQLQAIAEMAEPVAALFARLAGRYAAHILAPSMPAPLPGGRYSNRASFYGPEGLLGYQDKQVMTRFEREVWGVNGVPGLKLFDTALGRIGVLICYDSEFPLLARALVEAGAEVILVPSLTDSLRGYNRVRVGAMARALEGQCVVVHAPMVGVSNWSAVVDESMGAAAIYGPPDLGFPEDGVIAKGRLNEPGWVHARVDLADIDRVRREGKVLNFRHWEEQGSCLLPPVQVVC